MAEFKVGDKVRITKRFAENTSSFPEEFNRGAEGFVAEIQIVGTSFHPAKYEGDNLYIVHKGEGGQEDYYGMFIEEELELLSNREENKKELVKLAEEKLAEEKEDK